MTRSASAPVLAPSPEWYPLSVTGEAASMVRLTEADYAAASFLDERVLGRNPPRTTLPLEQLTAAAAGVSPAAHYIFHIGHVGSTLISRLAGEHPSLFSLREPALLRAPPPQLPLDALLALLARTWRAEQRALIKATSFVNEIAPRILAESVAPRALFVHASPIAYLRGILGGPNSRIEARKLAPARWRRLCRRLPAIETGPAPHTEGEWIAMSWLCEMSALGEAASLVRLQAHWVDFDEFLRAPADGLGAIFRALDVCGTDCDVEALVGGPIMKRYSKAPEYPYDAALRNEVLVSADREHAQEVRQGMRWLETAAQADPAVRRFLR